MIAKNSLDTLSLENKLQRKAIICMQYTRVYKCPNVSSIYMVQCCSYKVDQGALGIAEF